MEVVIFSPLRRIAKTLVLGTMRVQERFTSMGCLILLLLYNWVYSLAVVHVVSRL